MLTARRAFVATFLLATFLLGHRQAARAQVVQLPTFTTFSVSTTVLVPDRGSVYLGGITRAREGSVRSGLPIAGRMPGAGRLFANQAMGREMSSQGASVSATILDLRELDQAVLAEAARRRQAAGPSAAARRQRAEQVARKAAFISRHLGDGGGSGRGSHRTTK